MLSNTPVPPTPQEKTPKQSVAVAGWNPNTELKTFFTTLNQQSLLYFFFFIFIFYF
jgi:hypothetical protein